MNNLLWSLIIMILMSWNSEAQTKRQPVFDHPLNNVADEQIISSSQSTSETSINILAVMVEFMEDSDDRTTGEGKFDLTVPVKKVIDVPPHNKDYFRQHLRFLENYFRKVSDGKVNITATILDSIYTLPQVMKYYSPTRNSKNNTELGYLVRDTWKLVDSLAQVRGQTVQYKQYNTFIIFHAGVGRDIDLVSIYGYDPTPFDLPSLYVNLKSLRSMFSDPGYAGVLVNNGQDTIKNSIILPETETRDQVPFPLGINGLMAASIGSHLGLPDLFNTKNGRSGIGRFGLMDGQSIFSWNGVFPPEPSAWEKYFLGWIRPITVSAGNAVYNLPAVSLQNSADTVYKVLISAKEYFLLENRNRDAGRDSVKVTMVVDGNILTKIWTKDTTNFNASDQDSLYGVVIDVDDFDWSLPGGYDKQTNTLYDGGVLIWHIDENVIDENIAANSVNANPSRRGVNLMEADGSQDIGQNYDILHPGSGSESGTALDYWFQGNFAPLRKYDTTGFTPISHPNSMSNDLANSHIYINRFSERGPHMTARIKIGDEIIQPLPGFPKNVHQKFGNNSIAVFESNQSLTPQMIVSTKDSILENQNQSVMYGWNLDGSPILPGGDSSGILTKIPETKTGIYYGKVGVGRFNSDLIPDIAIGGWIDNLLPPSPFLLNTLSGWSLQDQNADRKIDSLFEFKTSRRITTSPVISDSFIAFGAAHGTIYFVKPSDSLTGAVPFHLSDTADVVGLSLWDRNSFISTSSNGRVTIIKTYNQVATITENDFARPMISSAATGYFNNRKSIVFSSRDGFVYVVDSTLHSLSGFPVTTGDEILNSPAIADIDGDNVIDIIVFSGNRIYAINAIGAVIDNFPVVVPTNQTILTSPIVADIDGDGAPEIVAVTQEGLVVAYDRNGKMVDGFPLLAGQNNGSTPAAFYVNNSLCLSCIDIAVASDDGYVYAWKTGRLRTGLLQPPSMPWSQYLHDAQNTGLIEDLLPPQPRSSEFLPISLAYNWPNPVTVKDGFKTHIRYFIHDDAKVHIKIFDPAGDLVTEFDGPGIGGLDNEVEWSVNGVQSGIYFAHIQANGTTQSGHAIIKVAVVK